MWLLNVWMSFSVGMSHILTDLSSENEAICARVGTKYVRWTGAVCPLNNLQKI